MALRCTGVSSKPRAVSASARPASNRPPLPDECSEPASAWRRALRSDSTDQERSMGAARTLRLIFRQPATPSFRVVMLSAEPPRHESRSAAPLVSYKVCHSDDRRNPAVTTFGGRSRPRFLLRRNDKIAENLYLKKASTIQTLHYRFKVSPSLTSAVESQIFEECVKRKAV